MGRNKRACQDYAGFIKPGQTLEQVFKEELADNNFPKSPVLNIKTNDVAYMLIDKKEWITTYTN